MRSNTIAATLRKVSDELRRDPDYAGFWTGRKSSNCEEVGAWMREHRPDLVAKLAGIPAEEIQRKGFIAALVMFGGLFGDSESLNTGPGKAVDGGAKHRAESSAGGRRMIYTVVKEGAERERLRWIPERGEVEIERAEHPVMDGGAQSARLMAMAYQRPGSWVSESEGGIEAQSRNYEERMGGGGVA